MPSVAPEPAPPAFYHSPTWHKTYGDEVADLCAMANFTPDPEQRIALDMTFAVDAAGKSAARDVGVCVPRQNLKTGFLKQATLGWLYVLELRLVIWSAHEFGTAQESFRDLCQLIESNPDLDREVKQIHRGNGDEAIELRGDRRVKFKARTKSGGLGLTGDRIVLDEAMLLAPAMMSALTPTLRAVPDPQLVFAGSAGWLQSDIWRMVRDRGRSGSDPSLAWLEYCDPNAWLGCRSDDCTHVYGQSDGCALDDIDRLIGANPLTGRRVSLESLLADRRVIPPKEYARETFGWWEDPPTADTTDDVLANWGECADGDAIPTNPLVLAVDVSHDSKSTAIVACGGHQSMPCLEVVDYRPKRGVGWAPNRLAELVAKHKPSAVAVCAGGPAMAMVKRRKDSPTGWVIEAKADGKPVTVDVTVVGAVEQASASQAFAQDVTGARLRHRGEQAMAISVRDAVRKFSGDGWRWSRRQSKSDISPLVAGVAARHVWLARPAPPPTTKELMHSFG